MDPNLLVLYLETMEEEENEENRAEFTALRRQRRHLRDNCNPLDFPSSVFKEFFRLSKEAFIHILNEVEAEINTSSAIPPILKLAACLRFFAEGGYQRGVGNEFDVGAARTTFCKVLSEVLNVLEMKLCSKWISIVMSEEEKQKAKQHFYERSGFPRVIGCIDGTHIKIVAPKEDKHLFYNRKGFYSLNAMILCDSNMRIQVIDARHPGSCHDASIWRTSEARAYLNGQYTNVDKNFVILGDAGYPLEPFIMTPYREPCTPAETRFNKKHAKARNVIERTIGVLKNRFRCLLQARELYCSPEKAIQIINVCCALHNICVFYNIEWESEIECVNQTEAELQLIAEEDNNNDEAKRIRNAIRDSFYN